jgi:hypothetical protein
MKYRLLIENNSGLTDLQGLRRLKSLSKLEILSNSSLLNLNGLDSLSAIIDNPYSITIWSNGQLQSLDGLQQLRTAHGTIQISVNSALTNFCGLKPLFIVGYNASFITSFNASNPTQSQVVSSCP